MQVTGSFNPASDLLELTFSATTPDGEAVVAPLNAYFELVPAEPGAPPSLTLPRVLAIQLWEVLDGLLRPGAKTP